MFSFLNSWLANQRSSQLIPGLVPTVPDNEYPSHQSWALRQQFSAGNMAAFTMACLNPTLHHCRIGKIMLKQAD